MNLEELERLAKEATPNLAERGMLTLMNFDREDREYIAAANPKVILEMIEEIKRLRDDLRYLNGLGDH